MQVGAIETAIDVGYFVTGVADIEVAPHSVTLAAAGFHVELAQSRRHFRDDTVIAERREVASGINAPE